MSGRCPRNLTLAIGMMSMLAIAFTPLGFASGVSHWVVGQGSVAGEVVGGSFYGGIITMVDSTLNFIGVDSSDPTFKTQVAVDPNTRYVEVNGASTFGDPSSSGTPPPGQPGPGYRPNDPLFASQYALPQVNAPLA